MGAAPPEDSARQRHPDLVAVRRGRQRRRPYWSCNQSGEVDRLSLAIAEGRRVFSALAEGVCALSRGCPCWDSIKRPPLLWAVDVLREDQSRFEYECTPRKDGAQ